MMLFRSSEMSRRIAGLLCVLFMVSLFTSCTASPATREEDVLTQTVIQEGKIPITILVKYAFSINAFEKAAEEKFPQLDIIQVGNYTIDRGIAEYERRLAHDDLTDIVMTWPLDVGEEYWEDRLLDLSGMAFTSKYGNSMLDTIARDGKLYYLPGPAQVRGIVYNKTLFEEKGWQVPKDFDGFVKLCQDIEASGIRSLQLGFGNPEVLETGFVGFSYGNCFSKPSDSQWLANYNRGRGSFGDHFTEALDVFQRMIDAGIFRKGDLDIYYTQREEMLFTRQCAMVEDSVLMAKSGYARNGCTDEFALMPFFSPGEASDWARLYMVCYIGLNKHLAEAANKEKYELVKQLMEYISCPEGQAALMADNGAMYSSLNAVAPPGIPEIQDLVSTLNKGRHVLSPDFKNAQGALRQGLAGMLSGTLSRQDVIHMVDMQNSQPEGKQADEVIAVASEDFTLIETGNFITDAMREKTGADIALFLDNGKDGRYNELGVSGKIYKGDQTAADVTCILPLKLGAEGPIQVVSMTGSDLLKTLEYSVTVGNGKAGWFYYFSGLRMEFDPVTEPGGRIRKITAEDGADIAPNKVYTIAVLSGSVPVELTQSSKDAGVELRELIVSTMREKGELKPSGDGRFTIVEQ